MEEKGLGFFFLSSFFFLHLFQEFGGCWHAGKLLYVRLHCRKCKSVHLNLFSVSTLGKLGGFGMTSSQDPSRKQPRVHSRVWNVSRTSFINFLTVSLHSKAGIKSSQNKQKWCSGVNQMGKYIDALLNFIVLLN